MNKFTVLILFALASNYGCVEEKYVGYSDFERASFEKGPFGNSGPYKIYSFDKEYYMTSFPYEYVNVIGGDLCSGITKVFNSSTNRLAYEIDRYFGLNNTYFNEDGSVIAYINNYWQGSSYDSCSTNILEFYRNGELHQSYQFEELQNVTLQDSLRSWLFLDSRSNKWLAKNHHYLHDSLLYLVAKAPAKVITANINTGQIIQEIDTTTFLKNLKLIPYQSADISTFPIEEYLGLPLLKNGSSFVAAIGETFDLEVIPIDSARTKEKYYYYFFIDLILDNGGNVLSSKVSTNEHVLKADAKKMKRQIEGFLKNNKFKCESMPYNLSKWKYEARYYICQGQAASAINDSKRYTNEVCQIDSIDNLYIPIDLKDCHKVLDNELTEKDKQRIADGEPTHFGLDMQLRNQWGLWRGSRLKCYFQDKGLMHPDHMSGMIMTTYVMKLNDEQFDEDSIISEALIRIEEWHKNH